MKPEKLWVLLISWISNERCGIYEDEERAREVLYSYVADNWEYDEEGQYPLPEERSIAIECYFAHAEEEWYYLQQVPVFWKQESPCLT